MNFKLIRSTTILFMAFTMSCNTTKVTNQELSVSADLVSKSNDFSMNLWKTLPKFENPDKNYFISPLSLEIALGMLLNGANGNTKTEIQKVLGLENESIDGINAFYKELIEKLPQSDPKVINTIANAIWQDKNFVAEKSFTDILSKDFQAKLYVDDFSNTATVQKINNWAAANTNNKVPKVIEEIDPSMVMILLNALYFKGDWTDQFEVEKTKKAPFNGTLAKTSVDMMNKTGNVAYADMVDYQMVELPYGNKKYVMQVILPKTLKVEELVNKLSASALRESEAKLKETKIIFEFPKFKTESSIKLNEILKFMGMPTAFGSGADFSKIMKPAGKLNVGFVKQDTYISVDEKGTEAAAVTSIGIVVTSVPVYPEVICNKPFVYIIKEKTSSAILFVGKVSNL